GVADLAELDLGVFRRQPGDGLLRSIGNAHGAGADRSRHTESDDGLAVEKGQAALLGGLITHVGDRIEAYGPVVRKKNRQRGEVLNGRRRRDVAHALLLVTDTCLAPGQLDLDAL